MGKLSDSAIESLFGGKPESKPKKKAARKLSASEKRLRKLKCFDRVDEMVREGVALAEVARFIQEESEELVSLTGGAVRQILVTYRDDLPPAELVTTIVPKDQYADRALARQERKLSEGLNELDEMAVVYDLAKQRVRRGVAQERRFNTYNKDVGKDVERLGQLLSLRAQLKMDLGIDIRHLGRIETGELDEDKVEGIVGKRLMGVFTSPEKRRRIVDAARIFSEMEEKIGPARLRKFLDGMKLQPDVSA